MSQYIKALLLLEQSDQGLHSLLSISEKLLYFVSSIFRALDKREHLMIIRDNFCLFCIKTYVVTPHLNRLDERVQMRGHNIWF